MDESTKNTLILKKQITYENDDYMVYHGFIDFYGPIEDQINNHTDLCDSIIEKVLSHLKLIDSIPSKFRLEIVELLRLEVMIEKVADYGFRSFKNYEIEMENYTALKDRVNSKDSTPTLEEWKNYFNNSVSVSQISDENMLDTTNLEILDLTTFMRISYKNENYVLTPNQAILVKILYDSAKNNISGLTAKEIIHKWPGRNKSGIRVDKIFKQRKNSSLDGTLLKYKTCNNIRTYSLDI